METNVIVRSYGGVPLHRVVVGVRHGRFLIANPAALDRVRAGESFPVGFPQADVFEYTEDGYNSLIQAGEDARNEKWLALKRASKG